MPLSFNTRGDLHQRLNSIERGIQQDPLCQEVALNPQDIQRRAALLEKIGKMREEFKLSPIDPLRVQVIALEQEFVKFKAAATAAKLQSLHDEKQWSSDLSKLEAKQDNYNVQIRLAEKGIRHFQKETDVWKKLASGNIPQKHDWKSSPLGTALLQSSNSPRDKQRKERFSSYYGELQAKIGLVEQARKVETTPIDKKLLDKKRNELLGEASRAALERLLDINPSLTHRQQVRLSQLFENELTKYRKYADQSGNFHIVSLGAQSASKEWVSPDFYAFKLRCQNLGYAPNVEAPFVFKYGSTKDILTADNLEEHVKSELEGFKKWALEHPQQAKWMMKDMLLWVAALDDKDLLRDYNLLIGELTRSCKKVSMNDPIDSETGRYLELAESFHNLWRIAQEGNPEAKKVMENWGLTDCPNHLFLSKKWSGEDLLAERRGVASFVGHVKTFDIAMKSLKDQMFQRVLASDPRYIDSAINYLKVESTNPQPVPKSKKSPQWEIFSFSRARAYLAKIGQATSWGETTYRLGTLVFSGTLAGAFVGGGVALAVLTGGIGAIIAPAIIGLVASVPDVFVGLNEFGDKLFPGPEIGPKESREKYFTDNFLHLLQDKGIVTPFQEISPMQLSMSEKKKAYQLYEAMRKHLDQKIPEPSDLNTLVLAFEEQMTLHDPRYEKLENPSDIRWIYAAFNSLKADWFQPHLKRIVSNMTDWTGDSSFNPDSFAAEKLRPLV